MNHPHDDLEQPHDGEPEEDQPDYAGPCECSDDGLHLLSHGNVCEYCDRSIVIDDRDEDYERAAARARSDDFADTNGKDWT